MVEPGPPPNLPPLGEEVAPLLSGGGLGRGPEPDAQSLRFFNPLLTLSALEPHWGEVRTMALS